MLKIIFVLLLLYLLYELSAFWYKQSHLPQLPAINQSAKTLGQGPPLRYIAAGDSTAAGIGASSFAQSYPYKLAQYFAKTNTVAYQNIAVLGSKTSDVLQKQVSQIIAFKPDVITISIGANDATHLVPSASVLRNYKAIISALEAGTEAKIYITDIANFNGAKLLPWFYIDLIEWRSQGQNRSIKALQDARVKIVDIHNFGWAQAPYSDRSRTYADDHFHPNDLGYQNWTAAFLSAIQNP